jgi:uncharacterized BrkB/YihY/UPF0761 family membrane protein
VIENSVPPSEHPGDAAEPIPLPPARKSLLQRLALVARGRRRVRARIERARERSRLIDTTFATLERDSDIGGGILAGALAYRLFVFALPLGFFLVSALGVLADALGRNPQSLGQDAGLAGLVTEEVASAASGSSNWWVALTSFAVLVYVTKDLYRGFAIVHSFAWHRSAAHVNLSARSLAVFDVAVACQLALAAGVGVVRSETRAGGVAALLLATLVVVGLWCLVSLQLPHATARLRDLIPGALLYAVGFLAVQVFNVYLFGRLLESKSSTYGTLGTAAAILLALFLIGRLAIAAAVLNATLFERRAARKAQEPRRC